MGDSTTVVDRAGKDRPESNPESSADKQRRADALAANIATRLGMCSLDELRVVDVILGRLEKGREDYGALELDGDPRNWRDEAAEELVDLAIYDACDRLAARDARRERLRCEAADEIAHAKPVDHGLRELRDSAPIVKRVVDDPDATWPRESFDTSDIGES